ncbi:MAG: hypothetical protein ICV87_07035 [Gemmatimonadetes bacterium]|nr:hypothetical protein [Gemmatimonadota bacterium]
MRLADFLFFLGLPLASAVLALTLDQRRARAAWLWMAGFGGLIAGAGFAAHKAGLLGTEGSGMTPIAIGLVVPLLALLVVRLTRAIYAVARIAAATGVCAMSVVPLALLSHYWLSDLVPRYFGCCPS